MLENHINKQLFVFEDMQDDDFKNQIISLLDKNFCSERGLMREILLNSAQGIINNCHIYSGHSVAYYVDHNLVGCIIANIDHEGLYVSMFVMIQQFRGVFAMSIILQYLTYALQEKFDLVKCKAHESLPHIQKLYSKFASEIIHLDDGHKKYIFAKASLPKMQEVLSRIQEREGKKS